MARSLSCLLSMLVVMATAEHAVATLITIDFETVSTTAFSTPLVFSFAEFDVTFTSKTSGGAAQDLLGVDLNSSFPDGISLSPSSIVGTIIATISPGFVFQSVQIENHIRGFHTSEEDIIVGNAFNAANGVVDSKTTMLLDQFLSLSGPGITRVEFNDGQDNIGQQTGFTIDNFSFTAVPEPSSFLFVGLASGITVFVCSWRRTRGLSIPRSG